MLQRKLWNDGPDFDHFLTDPDCPVPNRNVCFGGGGEGSAPNPPNYSNFISNLSGTATTLQGYGADLYNWAKTQGLDLTNIGKTIGAQAGTAAAGQQATSDAMMKGWESDYAPLYQAQRDDATRMYADLPKTEESYAGKYGADAAQAIDQQLAAEQRKMQASGISPGVGQQAIDTQARIGRAAATAAAGETGRMQARTEARNVAGAAIQSGQFIPGVAGQQAGLSTANRGQAVTAPATTASTAASLYNPSLGYYNAALPYEMGAVNTTAKGYDQQMAQYQANANNSDGGFMSTVLPLAGGIAGSYFGPMGAAVGSSMGKAMAGGMSGGGGFGSTMGGGIMGGALAAKGGKIPANGGRRIPRYAGGGAIDTGTDPSHMISDDMSPSGGDQVDDVPAMVSAGEFVIPERTVDWYGEKFFQNLISKADSEAQHETVAAPEEAPQNGPPMAAMNTTPPMFRSEGART